MKKVITACVLALTLAGCSSAPPSPTQNPSGFLPNYGLMKPVANSPQGTQIYTYSSPDFTSNNYNAAIITPVQLYQTATKNGITEDQIQKAQANIQTGITQIVSRKATIVTQPGPGVVTLSVAITGAQVDAEGFKPWNIIPVSAAIKLASTATGLDSKTPVMVVEIKVVDSISQKLLRETMTVISGEEFRTANTADQFTQLAQTWVQQALKYSATNN